MTPARDAKPEVIRAALDAVGLRLDEHSFVSRFNH